MQSANEPLQSWISSQTQFSKRRILSNIAPFADDPSALPGAVCASPSRHHPDYYYAWTRDSALVMNEMFSWLLLNQTMGDTSLPGLRYGLGEAKFHMDGSAFTGSWCNAQTDGPAIRAYMLTKYAGYLRDRSQPIDYLYSSQAKSVIKTDLEYIAEMWQDTRTCDIWEETRGAHFYTRMAHKQSNLDTQVLLAALHFGNTDSKYSAFESLYPINSVVSTDISGISVPIGVAIGRYPEDVYNGDGTSMGNPWSLATSAMA
ncbi:Six-hairpin glycosidase [Linderina pennispora]|uniref:glucan 1,4-alpha-glucosidase n=1 Tax=Linderina pennispora TaxID=61395 RepID=A0A1Y1WEF0_9FUNG|nr:Six-hairpin glycosidase [Linderina pennispora]ORX71775.1 Six-hairpin glycosidase [Linderina pennispora]